jgi:RNA polymerase sigma-70 factor (ECF subfamily)
MAIRADQRSKDERDVNLLQRVATKDKVAFEELYRQYYSQLSRYLSRLLRRPEMVEEVVNDTLFVVWEKAAQFQGRSKVSTWITGIAYLKGIKALDRVKKMPEQNANSALALDQLEEKDNLITKLGLQDWLRDGLEKISPEQRSVVELTYYFGYSYIEISEIMGCPVNTVKTRMFHARRKLGNLLSQSEEQNYGNVDESKGRSLRAGQLPSESGFNSDSIEKP